GVSLVDVPAGAGFVCVPGSHKSHFAAPDDLTVDSDPPSVVNLPINAGDCVVFTELLRHGARRWTLDTPRRTVFCRYVTSYASWSPGNGPAEEHRGLLSDELYELKQMASFRTRKKVVERLLARLASN
ncbi:MAG: phytanoyl-CoA dioxygenase family protein, partial [bacterium]|nr:phytanoyl-CoA dioxygenase family protein [bacterium]